MKLIAVGEGGEKKLIFWALRWKEKGKIHITYCCIQILTISTVRECRECNEVQ